MRQRIFIILILLILGTTSSGCNFMPSPDNTIASPRPKKNISSSNNDINSIITGFMPSSAKLLVPKSSENKNPIQTVDLDGDGVNEIIIIFMDEKQIVQSGFMILKKGKDVWEKQFEEPYENKTINIIDYMDITGDNLPEIFIGKDNILDIYHYASKQYELIKSIPYTEYTSGDLPGKYETDNMTELLVYNKSINEPAVSVFRWNGYILQDVSEEYPGYKLDLINYYGDIVNENPGKSQYWFNLSRLQMNANKLTDSLESIEKAIFLESLPDTLVEYKIFKSRILISLGRYDEAVDLASSSTVQRAPYIHDSKSVIAESYYYRGDYTGARKIYEEIAVFPYDENIQRVDTAIAEDKLYIFINNLGENNLSQIPDKLLEFGNDNNLVINSIIPRSSVNELSSVLIVDYHLAPAVAHGKDNVGAHLIYWWNNGKLYSREYTTIGLYSSHHLDAYLKSVAANIKYDYNRDILMRITFHNSNNKKNNYPDALNQSFLFKSNEWKFYWK